ncbi:FAD-binding protein [Saccharopolyspora ipomoeae]|uniref:FAD-binding protein n=1 Tax=Saccharopolyspora ipomoeae TaxID=3042027 RepID=UPI003CCF6B72
MPARRTHDSRARHRYRRRSGRTNADAQVLDASGEPVPGLYACGNDANSITASEYPGAGCQVGAGLTFGYLAARHAAHR